MPKHDFEFQKEYIGCIQYWWEDVFLQDTNVTIAVVDAIDKKAEEISKKYSTLVVDTSACSQFEIVAFKAESESEIDQALIEIRDYLLKFPEIIAV